MNYEYKSAVNQLNTNILTMNFIFRKDQSIYFSFRDNAMKVAYSFHHLHKKTASFWLAVLYLMSRV